MGHEASRSQVLSESSCQTARTVCIDVILAFRRFLLNGIQL